MSIRYCHDGQALSVKWGNSQGDYLLDIPPVHNSIGAFTLPYSQIHCILYSFGTPLLCTRVHNDADQ